MADPEQIYTEVLQEEQGKGVSAAVAEGRAKAARARAEQGSPHPKEPKWWPGAQPHLEGDGAEPAAAEEPAAEEAPAEPEPAAEEPAAEEAPAEPEPAAGEPAAEAPPAEAPAPAETPASAAPAPAEPAAAPAPAAAAEAPAAAATATELAPERRPSGVTHGVSTGTRLRPEDEVQTDAQFEGEAAVSARRKLIDEVVATEGPLPAAAPRSGQWALFLVYLVVVVGAIFFVVGREDSIGAGEGEPEPPGGGGGGTSVTAQNTAFDTDTLELTAGEPTEIELVNDDASSVMHNIAIYEDDSASEAHFQGETIPGGQSTTYEIPALEKGTYFFRCDVHPGMTGDVKVQ